MEVQGVSADNYDRCQELFPSITDNKRLVLGKIYQIALITPSNSEQIEAPFRENRVSNSLLSRLLRQFVEVCLINYQSVKRYFVNRNLRHICGNS